MALLALPYELHLLLPLYLRDIEDFKNLASTCRTFHQVCAATLPKTIFRLAAASSRTFFRPSPHFLVAATARSLAAWACISSENKAKLHETFEQGMDALLKLCLEHSDGLTMQDIRRLHTMRFSVINPVVDLIDKSVGAQWYATPNFWDGGVEDAWTINVDPPDLFFHIVIYGELFGSSLMALLDPVESNHACLDVDARLDFVKYCIPDWACQSCASSANDVWREDGTCDPRRAVKEVGPYIKGYHLDYTNQCGLQHFLRCRRWKEAWAMVSNAVGGDFPEASWKQDLWTSVLILQGLNGMEMLRPGGAELWKERLLVWRGKIDALTVHPGDVIVGRQKTYEFPFLYGDLDITTSGYVVGT